jgi:Rrf2 family protein
MPCVEIPARIVESLRTLACLADVSGPLQAQEIASRAGLPPAQTAKILQLLGWAGFVASRRGTKGGFWLVQPADRIRAAEVMTFLTHRVRTAPHRQMDPLAAVLARVLTRCQKEFDEITIADLAGAAKSRGGRSSRKTLQVQQNRRVAFGTDKSTHTARGAKS